MNLEKMYNELLEVSKNLDVLEEMLIEKDAKIAELEQQLAEVELMLCKSADVDSLNTKERHYFFLVHKRHFPENYPPSEVSEL